MKVTFLQIRSQLIISAKRWKLLNLVLGSLDILAIALAFQFSFYLNFPEKSGVFLMHGSFLSLFLGILPVWLLILYLIKIAEIPRTKRYRILFFEYLQSAVWLFLIVIILSYIFNLYLVYQHFIIELIFFGFPLLFLVRLLEYVAFKSYRAQGYNKVNVVIIADDLSDKFITNLLTNKEWGYKIFAIFTESDLIKGKYEESILLFPVKFLKVLHDLMEVELIDEVLYLKNKVDPVEVRELIRSCEELGVTFKLKYSESKIKLTNALKTEIAHEKFLTFINVPNHPYLLAIKRIMDIFVSLMMIVIFSPLFIILPILIKATSRGPVIFRQARVGLRGRPFYLYKFRTMVLNAESILKELGDKNEVDGPVFKIKNDPRVTKAGDFIRKTGLDELPQLFNILKGEMSLIGPRPPLQCEIQKYKRWQLRRLSVKPGLSCFWQIRPNRNSIRFDKWMELDLAYIDNWSIRLDLLILVKTIGTVFKRTGL